jgi:hypothetical protein
MKRRRSFAGFLWLPGILLLCGLGLAACWLRLDRLERWCARQLTDTDGQPETTRKNYF